MSIENQAQPNAPTVVVVSPSLAQQPPTELENSSNSENQAVAFGQLLEQNRNLAEQYQSLQMRLSAVESQTTENQSAIQAQLARILEMAETDVEPEPEPEPDDVEPVIPEPEPKPEPEDEPQPEPEPTRQPPKWAKFLFG